MNAKQILTLARSLFLELQFGGSQTSTFIFTSRQMPAYRLLHEGEDVKAILLTLEQATMALSNWGGPIRFRSRLCGPYAMWSDAVPAKSLEVAIWEYIGLPHPQSVSAHPARLAA